MVLHEKNLDYDLQPCTQETKPDWLMDYYDGKMPALRHRKECYVESDIIAKYLDFFFQGKNNAESEYADLSPYSSSEIEEGEACTDGFFPAVARYLKSVDNGSDEDLALKDNLEVALGKIESHLSSLSSKGGDGRKGPFLVGDGEKVTLVDCSLAPKLYHLSVGLKAFKDGAVDIERDFTNIKAYMDAIFDRDSFKDASYPEEVVIWGWGNARK